MCIMPGPRQRVGGGQESTVKGADDLVVETGSFMLAREARLT